MTADVVEAINERRSTRAYLDKAVADQDLETVVKAGRCAPCAGTFHMAVVRNPGLLQKVDDLTLQAMLDSDVPFVRGRASLPGYRPLYGAPVLILLSSPADDPNSALSAVLAAENMLLQAAAMSLGSCFLRSPTRALSDEKNRTLARAVGIPKGYVLQCGVIVGHAAPNDKYGLGPRQDRGTLEYID